MDDASYEAKDVSSNIPIFLLKLVSMLNDSDNHEYVDWTQAGTSFIVKDQVMFSKTVLPKYFKHNKFSSFVRQLNMYGFRKITSLTQTGMVPDKDEVEFYHFMFIRGDEHKLSQIKRKVNKPEPVSRSEDVSKVLENVKEMRSHQDAITHRISDLKHENEELWREVMNLRQKHAHQQKVVNKLIQFLVNLVHQTGMGVKRRLPLMIDDGSSEDPPPQKSTKPTIYVEESSVQPALPESSEPVVSFPTSNREASEGLTYSSGPYITEVATSPDTSAISNRQGVIDPHNPDGVLFTNELDQATQPHHIFPVATDLSNHPSTVPDSSVLIPSKPDEVVQYYSNNAGISPADLTNHVDAMQDNIDTIQDLLYNNGQVQFDYNLIQELFGSSPDIMPPLENSQLPKETLTGNEVVLHSASDQQHNKELADTDLIDIPIPDYL